MRPVAHASTIIDGLETQILLQNYADRVLVLVTQLGKVGCLIQATIPQTTPLSAPPTAEDSASSALPSPPPSIQLTPILGHPPSDELHSFYNLLASQIATLIWTHEEVEFGDGVGIGGNRRPIIVGLALKNSLLGGSEAEVKLEAQFKGVGAATLDLLRA
ncbi:hypothetical protein DL93DRAFT_2157321 [Clavulina sp. PMI_390]|nr:hypothetical protein DL93DRAFT_2157321 [Clavulina sp. PMI_390]